MRNVQIIDLDTGSNANGMLYVENNWSAGGLGNLMVGDGMDVYVRNWAAIQAGDDAAANQLTWLMSLLALLLSLMIVF